MCSKPIMIGALFGGSYQNSEMIGLFFFFFNFYFYLFMFYLFMAVLGPRLCARAFSSWRQVGTTLHRGAQASHHRGLSCCRAQAPDAQAQ